MIRHRVGGYAAIILAMIFWGVSFVWTKGLLNAGFPVFTIVFLRLVLASVLFFTLFRLTRRLEKIRRGDMKKFVLLAFFEPCLYFIGENFGLKYVEASFAAVIIALIPVVVALAMHFTEGEPLRWQLLAGILVSVCGVVMIGLGGSGGFGFSLPGLLLLLLAVASAGGYSVYLAKLLKSYGPVTITTWQNILAVPFYMVMAIAFDAHRFDSLVWSPNAVLCIVCLAVFCSTGAYMLYSYAAKMISITKVSVFTNAIPVTTMIFAVMLGQEAVTPLKGAGIVTAVAGVMVSQLKTKARQ